MHMEDVCNYRIEVRGQVGEEELNMMTPLQMTVESAGQGGTCFSVRTDQSGLIGLLRHLHGLGFVFLSLQRQG